MASNHTNPKEANAMSDTTHHVQFLATNRNGVNHMTRDGETAICGSTKHSGRALPFPGPDQLVALHHSVCRNCNRKAPEAFGSIKRKVGKVQHEKAQAAADLLATVERGTPVTLHPHVGYGYSLSTDAEVQPWNARFNTYFRNGILRVDTQVAGGYRPRDLNGSIADAQLAPNGTLHVYFG